MTTINPNQGKGYLPEEPLQPAEVKSTGRPAQADPTDDVVVAKGAPTEDTMERAAALDPHLYLAAAASPSAALLSTQSTTTPSQPVVPDPAAAQKYLDGLVAAMNDPNSNAYDPEDVDDFTSGFNFALNDATNSNSTSNLKFLQNKLQADQESLHGAEAESEPDPDEIQDLAGFVIEDQAELNGYQAASQYLQNLQKPPTTSSTPTVGFEDTSLRGFGDIPG